MYAVVVLTTLLSAAPARSHSSQVLHDQCLFFAADPTNPWALAHGIVAWGPGFAASDGRKATDVIVKDFLQRVSLPDGGLAPGAPFGFYRYAKDGTPIEPHPNLQTKTFVLAGLKPSTKFPTRWGSITLSELEQSVERGFRHVKPSEEYWHDVAWTLDLFSQEKKPGGQVLTDEGPVPMDTLMNDALARLEADTTELGVGVDHSAPQVDKRKQGIYGHPCGGLHLVQAVLSWARYPEVRKAWGKRVERQIDILFYRLGSERRQYDAAYQQAVNTAPQYKLPVLVQMVKFYGHFLETTARLKTDLGWKPDAAQRLTIETAKALLDAAVRELEAQKAFESMATLKTTQPQVALDLIGDSCHAAHGLDGWQ
jgi:hypothetical protein